ncbi:MAG: CDP-glycerol glycerophosphotransferase family protein, partial [Saprospiraceae bacterium]
EVKKSTAYKTVLKDLKLNTEKPYLFVAMSAPRFAPHEIDIVEWLAKAVENDVFGKEMQLVLRPHPQNVQGSLGDKSWLKRLEPLNSERVAVDYPSLVKSKVRWSMQKSDMLRLSNLLVGCSVCLNSGSTVSIDALMLDKPVILTSFDGDKQLYYWKSARRLVDYLHLKKFTRLGGAKVVHSYEDLQEEIKKYLEAPDYDLDKRRHALFSECHMNDGQATNRVAEAMCTILEQNEIANV